MLLALLVFAVLPMLPTAVKVAIPVTQTVLMVVSLIAVCGIVGWWKGGSGVFAGVWLLLAVWMFEPRALFSTQSGYLLLSHAWVVLLAGAFGIASMLLPDRPFFTRALSAVGIAMVAALALIILVPRGIVTVRDAMSTEYSARAELLVTDFNRQVNTPDWKEMSKQYPWVDTMTTRLGDQSAAQLRSVAKHSASVVPALLALESLAALALAWVVYHRITSTPIGPMLGSWRDFRFNDQLIWGLAVGACIFFLPPFADGKHAGLNLLLFFGTLYLLRGVGVLSWITRGRGARIMLIIVTVIAPQLIAALALGVGVGDTWMDWRSRVTSA